ncbi:S8 family serine peptidase [Gottfriedia acidiceleris]|uniref:S8 family serine peptidase n=1 Tax=Gottfriedia acidiceleris TaxID=371036 RepID=UPI00101DD68D|nr:S8 family serine peptidase [Gottfriedia acidiceleris]
MKKRIRKNVTTVALTTGLVASVFNPVSVTQNVHAQSMSKVEQVLSALTPAQREAIKQLKISDKTGLQVSPDLDLTSDAPTSVIVEFKDKPAQTAVTVAETEGTTLSEEDAQAKVDASHESFDQDLKTIFSKELNEKKNPYKIKRSYKKAFNGVSMTLPANKVKSLLKSNAVQAVWSDLHVQLDDPSVKEQASGQQGPTHNMVTFPGVEKLHEEGYTGKGVKIGILDTGIDYNHPDLKGAFKGGYDFVDNDNDPMETTYADWKKSGQPETSGGEAYYTEHGTHVAGIIAGQGKNNADYAVTGVAPDADIYAYRVLGRYGSGQTSAILAGIDKAVSDGMDIISMSLGANYNDPLFPTAIAVNNAVLSGVTAVVAAGNSGNRMYTLGSPGNSPLAITVGASDTSVTIPQYSATAHPSTGDTPVDMKLAAQGYSDNVADLQGQTFKLVNVGFGKDTSYYKRDSNGNMIPRDVDGKIVVATRGSVSIADIVSTAIKHGAKAVILSNADNDTLQDVYLGNTFGYIPTFLINSKQGHAITGDLPLTNAKLDASIDFTFGNMSQTVTQGNKLADFSSRGPSRVLYDIKPEVTAPGVSVFSTVPAYMHKDDNGNPLTGYQDAYERLSGTSMATPNVSGVAALLKQAHPDMTPADIKATLMNTADPLNDKYSVYEVGAGLVNPYKAVHTQTEIQVKDKTKTLSSNAKDSGDTTLASKGIKTIKNITGALSFGEQAVNGKDLTDQRSITLFNKGSEDKTYDVKVQFQTLDGRFTNDSRADQDAAANGVTLDVKSSVKVKRYSSANMDATINVPKTAKLGTYEGYVVYTNQKNPDETYKIPFAIHTVDEGIDYVKGEPSAFTIPYEAASTSTKWSVGLEFKLKSHMRTFDFFLVDPKTNEEIGYLGTADGMGADENIEYYFQGILNQGQYYPLTGNPDNPITFDYKEVDPGLWKIRMVGTNDKGVTFTNDAPIFYGEKEPKVTMSYEAGQIVETANPTDKTVNVTGNAFDKDVAEMKAAGIDASQGDNKMYYYNPNNSSEINLPVDQNGNFNSTIPLSTAGPNTLPITEYDFYDRNKSTVENYGSVRDVYFVKKGTAYSTAISDKQRINMGDSTTVTFSTKNMATKVKKAEYSFLYPKQYLDIVSVNPHGTYNGNLDVQYTTTSFNSSYDKMTITATALGDLATTGITGDTSLVDLTFKAKDNYYKGPMQFEDPNGSTRFFKAVYTNVDNSTLTTQGIQPYFYITPTYSLMRGIAYPEGLINGIDTTGQPTMKKLDYNKAGTKISVKDSDGKEYGVSDPLGYSSVSVTAFTTRLPITDKQFTLSIDVPGHFTFKKDFTVGLKEDGKVTAGSKPVDYPYIPGGDVNKDNVIDVNDALYIQTYWGTDKRDADINYDGVVDAKDMQYVIDNYFMQNPWNDNSPKPVKKFKGKTLDNVLEALGLE